MSELSSKTDWSHSFTWYMKALLRFFILFFFVWTFLVGIYIIPTSSMDPAMMAGDLALVNKTPFLISHHPADRWVYPHRPARRNDIIAFWGPDPTGKRPAPPVHMVKRIAGLPGETLQIHRGLLKIEGRTIPYPAYRPWKPAPETPAYPKSRFGPSARHRLALEMVATPHGPAVRIPPGHLFGLGDNRQESLDSRSWGPIPLRRVIGTPWRVVWSLQPPKPGPTPETLPGILARSIKALYSFFSLTRWQRLGYRYR